MALFLKQDVYGCISSYFDFICDPGVVSVYGTGDHGAVCIGLSGCWGDVPVFFGTRKCGELRYSHCSPATDTNPGIYIICTGSYGCGISFVG